MFHLYKYKALPIYSDGHLLQLSGSSDLIAMSEDKSRFIEVSASMMDSCRKVGFNVLCSFSNITPGCSVQAGSVTFVSGFSPMVSVNHVLTFLPESFFKISNDSEVVDAVERALQSFEEVDYNTLLKLSLIHISEPTRPY